VPVRDHDGVAGSGRGRVRGRFRRKPLLIAVLVVGVIGALVIFALQSRPSAGSPTAIGLERGYVGTTYAFDGAVCLGSRQVAAEVLSVEVVQAPGTRTRLVRPPEGAAPTLGFPVQDAGEEATGFQVPAGEDDCTLRLLVTPEQKGALRAGTVRVRMGYGPFGLLRRTAEVRPQVTLDVTGEGADPRNAVG
jgi:hypothetical protein